MNYYRRRNYNQENCSYTNDLKNELKYLYQLSICITHVFMQKTNLLQSEWCKNKSHFRRVRTVAQKRLLPSSCLSACPPGRMYCTSAAPTRRISVTFDNGDFYEDLSINFKFGYNRLKTSGTLQDESRYILFLPVTLHRHNSSLFKWNGIMLLGQPRRYKNCANAPQCYVTLTFTILTLFMSMH